jgi:CBS domain-containing protein
MNARDIMTTNVQTLPPDCTIGEAVGRFGETKFQAFPIVDGKGALVGTVNIWRVLRNVIPPYIVSGDLPDVRFAPDLELLHERLGTLRSQPVTNIMNKNPPAVPPDCSVLECAALMVNAPKTIHLLPVLDNSKQLLGIVTPWDLIKEIA